MAQKKFVSPGVYTSEIDQSSLTAGVSSIGATVIGRFAKGPALVPTVVKDYSTDFIGRFGGIDPNYQGTYAAQNYLKNADTLNVVRVLGDRNEVAGVGNGWTGNVFGIVDASGVMLAELHVPIGTTASLTGTGAEFVLSFVSGATQLYSATSSFVPTNSDYLDRVLNGDPTLVSTYGHYLYKSFSWAGTGSGAPYALASLSGATTASFDYDWTDAQTPWICSQFFGGTNKFNLFRFWHSSGESANSDIKVEVSNVRASTNPTLNKFGQFDVVVRSFSDTDQRQEIVERYPACDLDPTSINYVARRIGDKHATWNSVSKKLVFTGQFDAVSPRLRIEMASTSNYPDDALPWGFRGYPENGTSSGSASLTDLPYVLDNLDTAGNVVDSQMWGVDCSVAGVVDRLKATMNPSVAPQFTGSDFSLSYVSASNSIGGETSYVYRAGVTSSVWPAVPGTASVNGFVLPFFGGFDGWDMTDVDPLDLADSASASDIGVVSMKLALDQVGNPDELDMNVLALPGCVSNRVTDYARWICSSRADCIFIMDITGSSVAEAVAKLNARGIDDNYVAAYYPDVIVNDQDNGVHVTVKPSTVVLGAYAYNDRVSQPFFAPAGLNRGGLAQFNVIDVADRLNFADRDALYEARINPIATFPREGINVFGQKTLQANSSALDRVNVRRLMIYAKKLVSTTAKSFLFEPNVADTWLKFRNRVNPDLKKVQDARGIVRFKVVMDNTTNTPDVVDRNIMRGMIFLQPSKAAEYIELPFTVSASGVSFEE